MHFFNIILSFDLFQEKVRCVEGSREFLQALGFMSVMLPVEGQGKLILMPFDKQGLINRVLGPVVYHSQQII